MIVYVESALWGVYVVGEWETESNAEGQSGDGTEGLYAA